MVHCNCTFFQRTAVIRTCIKTLPPVLVIQLKRFGYDWEASRALKFDDYFKVSEFLCNVSCLMYSIKDNGHEFTVVDVTPSHEVFMKE